MRKCDDVSRVRAISRATFGAGCRLGVAVTLLLGMAPDVSACPACGQTVSTSEQWLIAGMMALPILVGVALAMAIARLVAHPKVAAPALAPAVAPAKPPHPVGRGAAEPAPLLGQGWS